MNYTDVVYIFDMIKRSPSITIWAIPNTTYLGCVYLQSGGFYCGYVGVKSDVPLHGKDVRHVRNYLIDNDASSFAEDINFASPLSALGPGYADTWWIGFDCAHSWHKTLRSAMDDCTFEGAAFTTYDSVKKQIENLAKRIIKTTV